MVTKKETRTRAHKFRFGMSSPRTVGKIIREQNFGPKACTTGSNPGTIRVPHASAWIGSLYASVHAFQNHKGLFTVSKIKTEFTDTFFVLFVLGFLLFFKFLFFVLICFVPALGSGIVPLIFLIIFFSARFGAENGSASKKEASKQTSKQTGKQLHQLDKPRPHPCCQCTKLATPDRKCVASAPT